MSFHVGQKVVCVDDSPCRSEQRKGLPFPIKQNSLHVVREVCFRGMVVCNHKLIRDAIRLMGVYQPDDWPFDARRFRPLEEMKEEARQRQQSQLPTHSPASK